MNSKLLVKLLTCLGFLTFLCINSFAQELQMMNGDKLKVKLKIEESQKKQAKEVYQRLRIYADMGQLNQEKTTMCLDRCCAALGNDTKGNYIEGDFSLREVESIKTMPFEYEVLFEDSNEYYHQRIIAAREQASKAGEVNNNKSNNNCAGLAVGNYAHYEVPSHFSLGSMAGFFTYQEMTDHMNEMAVVYPTLTTGPTPIDTFLTHENRPIYHQVLTAPNGLADKPQILFTGIHHAREPMSMTQNIFFMWYLLENYGSDEHVTYLMDNYEMHFIPCINPDGYIYNEEEFYYNSVTGLPHFNFWRGNKRDNNENGVFDPVFDGVDLNRNYGYLWGLNNQGSSPNMTSLTYRGPAPFSEPETQAVKYLCENNNFEIALNYHSYGNLLIYPWGFAPDTLTPDATAFDLLGEFWSLKNDYEVGTSDETIGYLVNGDSDDWMYGEQTTKDKILAMTPEVGSSSQGFYPMETEILPLVQKTVWQNLSAVSSLGSAGHYRDLSGANLTTATGSFAFDFKQYGLEAGDFTIEYTALSPELTLGANTTFTTSILEQGDTFMESVDYTLSPDAVPGASIEIAVSIDNGSYVIHDTLVKLNHTSPFDFEFTEDFEDVSTSYLNWTADSLGDPQNFNQWGLTFEEANSGSFSLTDSHLSAYFNSQDHSITLNQPIDLTDANWAQVSFFAKWELEPNNDYVQVFAVLEDGSEVPLCGEQSRLHPTLNEPVYHDEQCDWEREIIDLSDYFGQTIQIKLTFHSSPTTRMTGFYLDDFSIRVLHDEPDLTTFMGKIWLQGVYNETTGSMPAYLKGLGLLPETQPYNTAPYLYQGNEVENNVNCGVVDWVLVEMRSGTPSLIEKNTELVETKAGIVLENGDVLAPDCMSPLEFENLTPGMPYHVCIRHRNHLDVLSATPIIGGMFNSYDFTTAEEQAFGSEQLREIASGVYGLRVGDFNQDCIIQITDYDAWAINPALLYEYVPIDANLDGVIQVTDYDEWYKNKAKIGTPEVRF